MHIKIISMLKIDTYELSITAVYSVLRGESQFGCKAL